MIYILFWFYDLTGFKTSFTAGTVWTDCKNAEVLYNILVALRGETTQEEYVHQYTLHYSVITKLNLIQFYITAPQ